jgi:hypothetical protein
VSILDIIVKVLQIIAYSGMGIYWIRRNLKDKDLK